MSTICATVGCNNKARRRGLCDSCRQGVPAPPVTLAEQVEADRKHIKTVAEIMGLRSKYAEALKTIEQLEKGQSTLTALGQGLETYKIQPHKGSGTSEATAVLVASDWHSEEAVGAEMGGLNRYDLEIGERRAQTFFTAGLRLVKLLQQDVTINTAVLALLGDFITGEIHGAENAAKNLLAPTEAIVLAQNRIISGVEFILNNSKLNLVIPCHSGNHGRTTQTTRFGSENGYSYEYLMYRSLATYFKATERVQFIIPEGMHSYVEVYGQTIRFYHGHQIKYGGGVGGIFIPAYKAIAQWNKGRHADLDVFGHFHQSKDGANFLCNGSLIGYNAFALAIKADYEPPKQTLFLMDKKRGRTCTWPILVETPK